MSESLKQKLKMNNITSSEGLGTRIWIFGFKKW